MRRVDAEHALELAPVDDQDPVEALAPQRADPALGIGVGDWGSDWRPDDRDAFATEDLVEGAAELAVAVVKQEGRDCPRSASCINRFRACCAIQRPFGLLVLAMNSMRRRSSETKKRT